MDEEYLYRKIASVVRKEMSDMMRKYDIQIMQICNTSRDLVDLTTEFIDICRAELASHDRIQYDLQATRNRAAQLQKEYDSMKDKYDRLVENYKRLAELSVDKASGASADVNIQM